MRPMTRRRKLAFAGGAAGITLLIAGLGAAGAIAASRMLSPSEGSKAVIEDAASQLGVEPAELSAALKQALKNRIDEAVEAGRLSEEQANELKERIDSNEYPLLFGHGGPGRLGWHGFGHHGHFEISRDRGVVPRNHGGRAARRAPGQDTRGDREGEGQDGRRPCRAARGRSDEADRRSSQGRQAQRRAGRGAQGEPRRAHGSPRQRRASPTWPWVQATLLARLRLASRATNVPGPSGLDEATIGVGRSKLRPRFLLTDPSIEGLFPLRGGYLDRGIASPKRVNTRRLGRGEGSRALVFDDGRAAQRPTPTGRELRRSPHDLPMSSQVCGRPRAYGSQASPPVSQPIRTCGAMRDATRSRSSRSGVPSAHSSPTTPS